MKKALTRRQTLGILAAGATLPAIPGFALQGPALFEAEVSRGDMPEVAARLPLNPRVIRLGDKGMLPGRHGGTLRMLIGRQRDVRLMPIFGYARLVGYDENLELVHDILEKVDVEDDRVFTFHLRAGHRWSDGHPFTAEDFRYAWEDVIQHPKLPNMQHQLKVAGQGPRFEVIDAQTVRYTWTRPIPDFLPNLATPVPLKLFLPAHYMKQFHADYQDEETLVAFMEKYRVEHWRGLHTKLSRQNRPENPDLPTLEPWRPRTAPPAQQFVFERNPYFHRVDENGLQLPYVDRFELNISSYEIIPAKAATGDSDLQATGINFAHYTVLKEAEKRHALTVALWKRSQGSRMALYPNLNCVDDGWRALFRDVRMRRAMSLAVDRTEINKALFFGLCQESANTVLPESPLYRPEYGEAYTRHDPDEANRLLDELGFSKRGMDGLRKMPDGRMAGIVVETAGESSLEVDMLELITDHFRRIGLTLWTRSSQRDIFRSRVLAGQVVMSTWVGLDNALATADMPPTELAPNTDDQLHWPVWGVYHLSQKSQGKPPDLPEVIELVELARAWRDTASREKRSEIWHRMLAIHADQVYTIGTVNGALQPIVKARDLRNVPDKAIFGYKPTSMLGIYMPDTFWREV